MFRVNNKDTITWRRSGVFIVNFEHISLFVLVFLLLTGSRYMPAGYVYVHFYIWESGGLNLRERFLLKLMENIFGRNRLTEMVLFIRKGKVLSICASEKILLLYFYYFYGFVQGLPVHYYLSL